MAYLIKKTTSILYVGGLLLVLASAVGSIHAATLAGTLLHNGSPMSGITAETPSLWAYDQTAGTDITATVVFTYNPANGQYSITGLPLHIVTISLRFHLHGATETLPGNYHGAAYPDIGSLTSGELANYDIDERLIMHMTSPWDNDAIEFATFPGSPYPAHNSPVPFQWDAVPGRDEYSFVIKKYRDPDHPSGYGYISTVLDTRILTTSQNPLLDPSALNEHYQMEVNAWNLTANDTIAFYMTTYTNGYGVQYRFKVVPPHYGPWHVDKDATGKYRDGSDWEHAFGNIHDALNAASPGQEIWVAHDIYKADETTYQTPGDRNVSFALKTGVRLLGGYAGFGEPNPDARDIELYPTILSGDIGTPGNDSDNSYHVLIGSGTDGSAILDGFTVTGGNANSSSPNNAGGGMYVGVGSPAVFNCTFISNSASRGGAISNMGYTAGHPTFRNCMFLDNSAGLGGAVESQGGEPSFTNCLFSGNSSTSSSGGAVFNMGNSNMNMVNCTLSRNSATTSGGGIYTSWGTAGVELLNCILWENTDSGGMDESAQIHRTDATVVVDYSCIQGWTGAFGGTDNIGTDPMHVDPDGLDDTIGTADDNVRLSLGSPAINTGHPAAAYNDPDGSRNDMGVYGGPWADPTGGSGLLPGSGFLFTTVGNIPTSFITEDNLEPAEIIGTANVDPTSGADYSIPAYTNSPFGSKVRLHGLFGSVDNVDYYQVLIAGPWDGVTPPVPGDFTPLDDKLNKTLSWWDGSEWVDVSFRIGPMTVNTMDNMYLLTTDSFWSHLDLRLILDTRQHSNGLYTIRCKGYDQTGGTLVDVTPGNAKDLIIRIDNSPVTAIINNVKYDPDSPNYDPIDDGEIKECAIINLETDSDNLRFNITATHPNGYLRTWKLDNIAGKNDHRGTIASQNYSPTPTPLWFGVTGAEYASEDAPSPPAGLEPWIRCAYQFRLRAYSRVTNGYGYIYWSQFSDHYFLDLGGSYGCRRADVNRSGKVDFGDLGEVAAHWMETCPLE